MTISAEAGLTRAGEAGRSGPDVRSDVRVLLEPRASGGIQLELVSRVELYYGERIRGQARDVLRELGIEHARVRIEDSGALPFVISARIEAAARRAGLAADRRVLPERVAMPPQSAKDRFRRTRLYLPGSEPKYFVNAVLYKPDAIIFDLEDSVHFAEKDSAIALNVGALRQSDHFHWIRRKHSGQPVVHAAFHGFDHAAIYFGPVRKRSSGKRAQCHQGQSRGSHCAGPSLLAMMNRPNCFS